jgi:hypothetical protein
MLFGKENKHWGEIKKFRRAFKIHVSAIVNLFLSSVICIFT